MPDSDRFSRRDSARVISLQTDLRLEDERLDIVVPLLDAVKGECVRLADIDQVLEAHIIFDPRWD